MTNLLFHFLPLSSIKSRNMLSVRGGVRGVQKFYSISWRFRSFQKLTKKNLKIFQVPNFNKDRQTLLDALLSNFFTVFTVFAMEDKGKKVFTYCLSFLEEIGMSSHYHCVTFNNIPKLLVFAKFARVSQSGFLPCSISCC